VLDLACGAGFVRVAVSHRFPTREVHYTGIDNGRSGLRAVKFLTRPAPQTDDGERSTSKIREIAPHDEPPVLQEALKERFFRTELDLHDPKRLATQLGTLLGDERFDEVHVHLLHPSKHGHQPTGPHVLRAIAEYLRPEGRLYHLFQTSSPLFDFKPGRLRSGAPCPPAGTQGDVLGGDEQHFGEGASKGGLVLDKCGHRWWKGRDRSEGGTMGGAPKSLWVTRRFAGAEPDRRTAETYERLAEQYSGYSRYASHFVILRKRSKGEVARRGPRPLGNTR
jgi:hypothetical protein